MVSNSRVSRLSILSALALSTCCVGLPSQERIAPEHSARSEMQKERAAHPDTYSTGSGRPDLRPKRAPYGADGPAATRPKDLLKSQIPGALERKNVVDQLDPATREQLRRIGISPGTYSTIFKGLQDQPKSPPANLNLGSENKQQPQYQSGTLPLAPPFNPEQFNRRAVELPFPQKTSKAASERVFPDWWLKDEEAALGLNANLRLENPGANFKHVFWKRADNPAGGNTYSAWELDEETGRPDRSLAKGELNELLNSGAQVVHSGDVPHGPLWLEFTASSADKMAIHEDGSANASWQAIKEATELGARTLDPGSTKVFNALPQETDHEASQVERARMGGIAGSRDAWLAVNTRIRESAEGFETHVAEKQALLYELQYGDASVIVLYAHFDGERLYLPGTQGDTVSVDEIAGIDRKNDSAVRNRVIILAACSTAAKSPSTRPRSLVQVLLQKGIARTVFATDRTYNAWEIPALMTKLKSTPLRKAGGQLQPHVELEKPQHLEQKLRRESQEGELTQGE